MIRFGKKTLALLLCVLCLSAFVSVAEAATLTVTNSAYQTGTAPFDAAAGAGNDTSATNNVVRTFDTVTYQWEYSVNGGNETNVTMTSTLPVGMVWTGLPAGARTTGVTPVSSISSDGRTIIVNVGNVDSGTASAVYPVAKVLGDVPNGTSLSVGFTLKGDTSSSVTSGTASVQASSAPKMDLRKSQRYSASNATFYYPNINDPNGNPGVVCVYRITAEVSGGKGNEPLQSPITFNDVLSGVANYRLYTWGSTPGIGINGSGYSLADIPYGKINVIAAATTTRSVIDSGVWTANQAAAGQPIAIKISGANTGGNTTPTQTAGGSSVQAGVNYLLSGWVAIWIPNTDIAAAGGTAAITNTLSGISAAGVSGAPNVDSVPANNAFSHQLTVAGAPGGGGGAALSFSKSFTSNQGTTAAFGGSGYTVPGSTFYARVNANNNGTVNLTNFIMGDKVDNTTQLVTDISPGVAAVVTGTNAANYTVEYGTGNYADTTSQRTATLNDVDSTWYTDTRLVPGGNAAITKVRIKGALPVSANINLYINLTALSNPSGTILPNFAAYRANEINSGSWNVGTYNPTNNSGTQGTRLIITNVISRISKTSNVASVLAGDPVTFTLSPSLNTYSAPAIGTHDVTVTDTLPATMSYIDGSANVPPTSLAVNANGTTTIVWVLPARVANVPITPIAFQARASLLAVNGTNAVNNVVVSTPLDSSPAASRTASRTVTISNVSGFRVLKSTSQPIIGPDGKLIYTLSYTNLSATPLASNSIDLIDILPYSGDGRTPATNFSGTVVFESVSGSNGEVFYYTKNSSSAIQPDPNDPSNQAGGSTSWGLNFTSGGMFPASAAEVSGVRIKSTSSMPAGATRTLTLVLQTSANAAANTYTNRFSGRAQEFSLLVNSNSVSVSVAIDISGTIFANPNGNAVKDAGEAGFGGVTVRLLDGANNVLATTSTNSSGDYRFSNLYPGAFRVTVDPATLPAGYTANYDFDGTATFNTAEITLLAGQAQGNVNFGYAATASIASKIWIDNDGNGAQGTGEPGLGGVTVILRDTNGNIVATTTTDVNGNYAFSNIPSGNYVVAVDPLTLPAGLEQTYDLDGITSANNASLTLQPGEMKNDVNFGYRGTGAISGTVWNDANGNNGIEPGESILSNVSVQLTWAGPDNIIGNADDVTKTTTTGDDGRYSFSNLSSGSYQVTVNSATVPAGLNPVVSNQSSVTLTAGESKNNVDFGYQGSVSIGGQLWKDSRGTGTSAPIVSDPLLAGITVRLFDSGNNLIATTTTVADGRYNFANRAAGNYTVQADVPDSTLTPSYDKDGIATANSVAVIALGGQTINDVNFSYKGTASVAGYVKLDVTGSGDSGQPGQTAIAGATVTLRDGSGNVIATVTTGADGRYSFNNLLDGAYSVTVNPNTEGILGSYDPNGSIVSGSSIITTSVTLLPGETKENQNYGFKGTGSIGGQLWLDSAGSGTAAFGANDRYLPAGVTINLLDAGGNIIAATVSGANGAYSFANLPAGTYGVSVSAAALPDGIVPSYDRDGILTANVIHSIVLDSGTPTVSNASFSYKGTGAIGDLVWNDRDGNNVQNSGEPGLPGVAMTLIWSGFDGVSGNADDITYTQTTDNNGAYNFALLPAGNYNLNLNPAAVPSGMVLSTGTNPVDIALAAGQKKTDADFGFRGNNTIQGNIQRDLNGNGIYDAPPDVTIAAATVRLLDSANNLIATTVSAADGSYTFPNRPAGSYFVSVDPASAPLSSLIASYDYDGIGTQNLAALTIVGSNQTIKDVNFGYKGSAGLTGSVRKDTNGNGINDDGSTGLSGVTVTLTSLTNPGNPPRSTTTAADGTFNFDGLIAGNTYVATVSPATGQLNNSGLVPSYDPDSATTGLGAATFTVPASPATQTGLDFGYKGTGTISGKIWYDVSGTGSAAQNPGDPGMSNVVLVALVDANGNVIATTTSTPDGSYSFANLENGTYSITINTATLPGGLIPSYDKDGIATANKISVKIDAGQQNVTDGNFSYKGTGSIGDLAWNDRDGNGSQNDGEPGLAGVKISLTWAGFDGVIGTADDIVYSTVATDINGNYLFSNLIAGTYRLDVDVSSYPSGMNLTTGTSTQTFTLTAGQDKGDADFGFRGTGAISGIIWKDASGSGAAVPNSFDSPMAGVPVYLFDGAGSLLVSTVTDGNGAYTFPNRPAGNYRVEVVTNSAAFNTLTPSYDKDGIATPSVAAAIIIDAANQIVNDVNFSYKGTASIAGFVKLDPDGSGDGSDPGDPPISGVTVTLKDGSGNVLASTVTDSNGAYTFSGLLGGQDYTVVVSSPPTGLVGSYDPKGSISNGTPTISTVINVPQGTEVGNQIFGYKGTASLSGTVYNDQNANGTTDNGEPGIAGINLALTDSSGRVLKTVATDANGSYLFANLSGGELYALTLTGNSPGTVFSFGPQDDLNVPVVANAAKVSVQAGQAKENVDFGYKSTGAIGGVLWIDRDGNGLQNGAETGLNNVRVILRDFAGVEIGSTLTVNGSYSFNSLPAGNFTVAVDGTTLLPDLALSVGTDPRMVTLTPGEVNGNINFGYRGTTGVSGSVVADVNGSGKREPGDQAIANIVVNLYDDDDNLVASTTTAADGSYTFGNLAAGNYSIVIDSSTLPAGVTMASFDPDGVSTANKAALTLVGGVSQTGLDFGYRGDQALYLTKTANKQEITTGGLVYYTVKATNLSTRTLNAVTIQDMIPAGFKYVANSASVNGVKTEPVGSRPLQFTGQSFTPAEVKTITYALVAGAGITQGEYVNTVYGTINGVVVSNQATAKVLVVKDPDFDENSIIGKVFNDPNGNGIQDEGEEGIAGAKVVTVRGEVITTDNFGRFHLAGVDGGRWERGINFVMKLDIRSLPQGTVLTTENPRVIRLTPGLMQKVNFGVKLP